jgi:hypothetical protein
MLLLKTREGDMLREVAVQACFRISLWYNEANKTTGVCITMSDWKAMIDGSRTQRTL